MQPRLRGIPGHRGATLLRRDDGGDVELRVLTFWESLESIRAFAGRDTRAAVVAEEARTLLKDYDREVRTFEVLVDTRS